MYQVINFALGGRQAVGFKHTAAATQQELNVVRGSQEDTQFVEWKRALVAAVAVMSETTMLKEGMQHLGSKETCPMLGKLGGRDCCYCPNPAMLYVLPHSTFATNTEAP